MERDLEIEEAASESEDASDTREESVEPVAVAATDVTEDREDIAVESASWVAWAWA